MHKINLRILVSLFLVSTLFLLSACQTGRGYSASTWDYSKSEQAEQPPETLSEGIKLAETMAKPEPAKDSQPVIAPIAVPTVKVAILLPLSGQHKVLGQAMLKAAQLALFDINDENFELLPRDTQGTPEGARKAAHSALDDGAQLILGPLFANSVQAVKSIAYRSNVNVIGFSTDWVLAGGNTFIMGFLPFDQVARLANYVTRQGTYSNMAVITPSNDYGRVVTSAWQSITSASGLPPSQVMEFSPYSTNLSPEIRKFSQYDERNTQVELDEELESTLQLEPPFDAVLMPVGGELALSISGLLSQYDLPPGMVKRLGTGLFDDNGLATEPSMNGAWFAGPSPRLRHTFESRYKSNYGSAPPRLSTLAYDATALAAILAQRGVQRTGQPDFSRAAIMNPNGFAGIDGIFRFRSNGTAERGLAILEFRDKKIRVIEDAPRTFQNRYY